MDRDTNGANNVSRFSVPLVVANHADLVKVREGTLKPEQVRRETIEGIVDSGAKRLVLPQSVVAHLGIPATATTNVRYADNRRDTRDVVEGVHVELLGRHGTFDAIVEPDRTTALVGAFVLENLDFLIDCKNEKLVPRDPSGTIDEIE